MLWACHRAVSIRPHLSTSTTYACVKGVRPRSGLASRDVASVLDSPLNSDPQPREIQVTGHVRTVRHQKQRAFASIGDGTTTRSLQVLLDPLQATGLGTGTAVTICGKWQQSPPGKEQSHELHAHKVEVLGRVDSSTYPIQKKYHTAEFLRTIPHLRLRTPFNALLARLRSDCESYIAEHFRKDGFVHLHPPIITSSDCEGAGEAFTVSPRDDGSQNDTRDNACPEELFFNAPKYLTVSAQLHLEAFVHEHPRVWSLSPTFRAEKSSTPRHLSEFYMLEAEVRAQTLDEVMDIVEDTVRTTAARVHGSKLGKELLVSDRAEDGKETTTRSKTVARRWQGLKKSYWPRIPYTQAMGLLQEAAAEQPDLFHFAPEWNAGLQLEHEKFLAREIGQGSPVFVTDYPKSAKPFYMLESATTAEGVEGGATVACFDLLLPDMGELVGGSLREHDLEKLQKSMEEHGLQPVDGAAGNLEWYLDLRRYGSVPHGGFGLGFDRLLAYLSGVDNVRDVVQWPRYYGRCDA